MSLTTAIKRTIGYSRRYRGGLTETELEERLLGDKIYRREEIKRLTANNPSWLESCAKKRARWNREKMKTARAAAEVLATVKAILMVGVTGSVAAGYAQKNDDVDLIIIVKNGQLWWTRLTVKYKLWKLKIPQRQPNKKEHRDDVCLNLWLEAGSLNLPEKKRTEKNAVDLIMMKPVLVRGGIYRKLLERNSWVKKYVATGYSQKLAKRPAGEDVGPDSRETLKRLLNYLAFIGQYFWMKRKLSKEIINYRQAFFHPKG